MPGKDKPPEWGICRSKKYGAFCLISGGVAENFVEKYLFDLCRVGEFVVLGIVGIIFPEVFVFLVNFVV